MSIVFTPRITSAGLGVFQPNATGIQFTFTHIAVGTGTATVTGNETTLQQEIARFAIAGGGMNTDGKSASLNALITDHTGAAPQDYDISEVGFIGVDG